MKNSNHTGHYYSTLETQLYFLRSSQSLLRLLLLYQYFQQFHPVLIPKHRHQQYQLLQYFECSNLGSSHTSCWHNVRIHYCYTKCFVVLVCRSDSRPDQLWSCLLPKLHDFPDAGPDIAAAAEVAVLLDHDRSWQHLRLRKICMVIRLNLAKKQDGSYFNPKAGCSCNSFNKCPNNCQKVVLVGLI